MLPQRVLLSSLRSNYGYLTDYINFDFEKKHCPPAEMPIIEDNTISWAEGLVINYRSAFEINCSKAKYFASHVKKAHQQHDGKTRL